MPVEAVLTCWGNSHPFLERRINLSEAVKIGRSVVQARPAHNNAIFDCKVLSRNHALLWHDNGKFFLQDTKSSNGTFVNNIRLSKGNEDSAPRQLSSSDILQFGVDVVENSRKVTHSCIIATIKLFDQDGNEIKNPALDSSSSSNNTFQSQEFYQLVHYLQEALHREQVLEDKLTTLQQLVLATDQSAVEGWKTQINEDKLLARLDVLENQLCVFNKLQPEEGIRKELLSLQSDKLKYEMESKDSMQKLMEEKLQVAQKMSEIEIEHKSTEQEVQRLEAARQSLHEQLETVLEQHKILTEDHAKLKEDFECLQKRSDEEKTSLGNEKNELSSKVQRLTSEHAILLGKFESLQAERDFSAEQLNNIKDKMKSMKAGGKGVLKIDIVDKGVQAEMINLFDIKSLMNMQNDDDDDVDADNDDGDDDDKIKRKAVDDLGSSVVDKNDDDDEDDGDGDDDEDEEGDKDGEKDEEKNEFEFCEKPSPLMNAGDTLITTKRSPKSGRPAERGKAQEQGGNLQENQDSVESAVERGKLKQGMQSCEKTSKRGKKSVDCDALVEKKPLVSEVVETRDGVVEGEEGGKEKGEEVVEGAGETGLKVKKEADCNITDSQKELHEKDTEIQQLERVCQESIAEVQGLQSRLDDALQDFNVLSQHTRVVSIVSLLPFLALLLSLVIAFYPFFSSATATSSSSSSSSSVSL